TGGVTLTAGTTVIANSSALGSGLVTIAGGTLQDDGTAARTLNSTILLGAGTNTINATNTSFNFTLTGNIGGTGTLAKGFATLAGAVPSNSAGTLVLSTAETYSGATTVNQGTLVLAGNGTAVPSASFTVTPGTTLLVDNTSATTGTAVNNFNRIGDTA